MALTRYGQVPDGADPEEAQARERDLVRTVVAGRGLQIRVGIAPDARVQRRYGAMGVPTLALIDRQGRVRLIGLWGRRGRARSRDRGLPRGKLTLGVWLGAA